jgi:hypothetical protein
MRMRWVLTTLIDEAKIGHWDTLNAVWQHQPEECEICRAAIAAQTALSINFIDLVPGDTVRIGPGTTFGVVDHVSTAVDVRLGVCTAHGVQAPQGSPVGRFNGASLTRIEPVA